MVKDLERYTGDRTTMRISFRDNEGLEFPGEINVVRGEYPSSKDFYFYTWDGQGIDISRRNIRVVGYRKEEVIFGLRQKRHSKQNN